MHRSRRDDQRQCKPTLYCWRAGAKHYWYRDRNQGDGVHSTARLLRQIES
jgi:hypothetical protein